MYGYIVAMVWYVYENMCSTVGHLCSFTKEREPIYYITNKQLL